MHREFSRHEMDEYNLNQVFVSGSNPIRSIIRSIIC